MNLLFSCIGRRGYLAGWFRRHPAEGDRTVGTSNTHRYGYSSRDVYLAQEERAVSVFFATRPDMVIQEQLPGQEFSLDVLNDLDGQVVSVVANRKMLMRGGETDQAESVHHPSALDCGRTVGPSPRPRGPNGRRSVHRRT